LPLGCGFSSLAMAAVTTGGATFSATGVAVLLFMTSPSQRSPNTGAGGLPSGEKVTSSKTADRLPRKQAAHEGAGMPLVDMMVLAIRAVNPYPLTVLCTLCLNRRSAIWFRQN